MLSRILEKFVRWYERGQLHTVQSIGIYERRQLTDRLDSHGTGSRVREAADPIQQRAPKKTTRSKSRDLLLRPNVAYILTGGLGGLGRSLANPNLLPLARRAL